MASTGAPCTLYTESDLLVRTIRDVADDSIEAIVVDSESAFTRARTFLQVVAPLNAPRLCFYDRPGPIFYAFNVEPQIDQIHARTVPLPSGGALVIDQTEAMVAIDVNSGKSRSARDSETNAFNTNKEAVDEIARQLRLRDLGGIIVNDLIDMRSSKHRREIEERLDENLRRDRAKTTTLEISDFGMIAMTRQRMRPGLHKAQFMDCPHCQGSGEVRVPDAVCAEVLRRVALLFCQDRVARVEVICSVKVASALLSARRNALYELAHQILKSRGLGDPAKGLRINWTVASAGDSRNVIPASASAIADAHHNGSSAIASTTTCLCAHDTCNARSAVVSRTSVIAGHAPLGRGACR